MIVNDNNGKEQDKIALLLCKPFILKNNLLPSWGSTFTVKNFPGPYWTWVFSTMLKGLHSLNISWTKLMQYNSYTLLQGQFKYFSTYFCLLSCRSCGFLDQIVIYNFHISQVVYTLRPSLPLCRGWIKTNIFLILLTSGVWRFPLWNLYSCKWYHCSCV
jgi:hypothetical protein